MSKKDKKISLKISKDYMIMIIGIVGIVVGFLMGYLTHPSTLNQKSLISEKQAGELAKNTFTKLLYDYYSSMGMNLDSLSLDVEVNDVKKFNDCLYEVYFLINGREYPHPLYISCDGETAFLQKVEVVEHFEIPKPNITKSEVPNVSINVMSFCPYGNQIENVMIGVIKLLKDKVNFVPHYIIYKGDNPYNSEEIVEINGEKYWSLHGNRELYQDVREKVIYNLYGIETWAEYVVEVNKECSLNNIEDCWKEIAKNLNLDVERIEEEYNNEFDKIVLSEYEATSAKGIKASPTLFINDYKYNGERSTQALKDAICEAFIDSPEECNLTLSNEENASAEGLFCG